MKKQAATIVVACATLLGGAAATAQTAPSSVQGALNTIFSTLSSIQASLNEIRTNLSQMLTGSSTVVTGSRYAQTSASCVLFNASPKPMTVAITVGVQFGTVFEPYTTTIDPYLGAAIGRNLSDSAPTYCRVDVTSGDASKLSLTLCTDQDTDKHTCSAYSDAR